MAKYTIEVRRLAENHFDFGLKEYPIFDESYREELNRKIIHHYYFREIGLETAELFKFYLNTKMAEIMPYYNELYKSALFEFNPLENINETETITKTGQKTDDFSGENTDNRTESGSSEKNDTSETSEETSNTREAESLNVSSDTPQGMLSIGNIKSNTYASQAEMAEASDSTTGTATGTETANSETEYSAESQNVSTSESLNEQNYTETIIRKHTGNKGENFSEMVEKFRRTLINVDMLIINELKDLFLNLY